MREKKGRSWKMFDQNGLKKNHIGLIGGEEAKGYRGSELCSSHCA